MSDPIVSIDHIQRRAIAAYAQGLPASANPFPWHSHAYQTWADAFAALEEGTPLPTNTTVPHGRQADFETAQKEAA